MADMWTLRERVKMNWSLIHPGGTVQIFFTVGRGGKCCVRFCDLYDAEGVCRGLWARPNMNPVTTKALDDYCNMSGPAMRIIDMRDWNTIPFQE